MKNKDLTHSSPSLDPSLADILTDMPNLSEKLHLETARIRWSDLQTFFARGVLIKADGTLDLVEVATHVARDDVDRIKPWLETGQLGHVQTEDARRWAANDAQLWAVVTRPWVLVQE